MASPRAAYFAKKTNEAAIFLQVTPQYHQIVPGRGCEAARGIHRRLYIRAASIILYYIQIQPNKQDAYTAPGQRAARPKSNMTYILISQIISMKKRNPETFLT
jgi:hypothetical protein